jgi:HEAT repeat protein
MNASWLRLATSILALSALVGFVSARPAAAQAPAPGAAASAPAAEAPAATEPAADAAANEAPPPGVNLPGKDPLEENFAAYLHFALVGQFDVADKFGQAFLKLPGVSERPLPKEVLDRVLAISDRYQSSIDTLLTVISNTPIAESAKKILDVVQQAHRQARMNPARIKSNIELLAGTPMQEAVSLQRLRDSGEYSVPWLLETLADPKQENLHPFIVRALPLLGKKAVNPLVEALSISNPAVAGAVADALGRLGYPQALPYLQRLASDAKTSSGVKEAAQKAIDMIITNDPAAKQHSAAELFRDLAEQYYANAESLRPDASEPRANVWFLRDNILTPVDVPPEIYRFVMAMRAARSSLALNPSQPAVDALWLAADFKREGALGMDVASDEKVPSADASQPADFPRSIYFARALGPAIDQLVLSRAVHDLDPTIALGSIAALNVTAGPAAMVEPSSSDGTSLAEALYFPDQLVRIRAALALARALPQQPFHGSEDVVPVLASAVQLTGNRFYLLADPDDASRTRTQQALSQGGATVVAAGRFTDALDQAHRQLTRLDGVFLSTGLLTPTALEAVRTLGADRRFALTPIVLIVRANDNLMADQIAQADRRIGRVFEVKDGGGPGDLAGQMVARRDEIAGRFGHKELSPEVSLQLALEAAHVLRTVAINRSPVLDPRPAQAALISALAQPSEELRIASSAALALINSGPAQRAIADVALAADQTPTMRKAAFSALAESGRRFGNLLEAPTVKKLLEEAIGEPNLELRTSASQALGALNLPGRSVSDVILTYTRGQ